MPAWIRKTLGCASLYYIVLGLTAIFFPRAWYVVSGLYPLNAEVLMAAFGAVLIALGVGALVATFMPRTQWGIVAVLLLHNALDLTVLVGEISANRIGAFAGWSFVLVDAAWVLAFSLVLLAVYRAARSSSGNEPISLPEALSLKPVGEERSLGELSESQPLLLILLRHSGCTFCRSHLALLVREHQRILDAGYRTAIVTMSPPADLAAVRADYPLPDAVYVSDPERRLYRALGARRGSFRELFGLRELSRGLIGGALFRYGLGEVTGDPTQLGGTYIIKNRAVLVAAPATSASDICPLGEAFAKASAPLG